MLTVDPDLEKTICWLRGIGLEVVEGGRPWTPHVDGMWIDEGVLVVAEDAHVGDVIHEAGHLAILPSGFRELVLGDVDDLHLKHAAKISNAMQGLANIPECSVARALMQSSDTEACAWSYAAALEIGVDPTLPFVNGFDNDFVAQEIFESCMDGHYIGIHGLRAAGFCDRVSDFPILKKWVQP